MARAEAKEMLLSFRALFLVITYGVFAGGAAAAVVWLDNQSEGKLSDGLKKMSEADAEQRDAVIKGFQEQGLPTAVIDAVLSGDLPAFLVIVLKMSTFVLPALIILVGFNRISGDIASRFTRYVLQRVHRGSYLTGKVFGHFLVTYFTVVLVHSVLLGLGTYMDVFDIERTVATMPRIWAGMVLFVLVYVAYAQMLSTLFQPPFLVLLMGLMLIFFINFMTFVLQFMWKPLGEIWIGDWDMRLWALDPVAIAVFLGYSGVFLAISYVVIRRRDL